MDINRKFQALANANIAYIINAVQSNEFEQSLADHIRENYTPNKNYYDPRGIFDAKEVARGDITVFIGHIVSISRMGIGTLDFLLPYLKRVFQEEEITNYALKPQGIKVLAEVVMRIGYDKIVDNLPLSPSLPVSEDDIDLMKDVLGQSFTSISQNDEMYDPELQEAARVALAELESNASESEDRMRRLAHANNFVIATQDFFKSHIPEIAVRIYERDTEPHERIYGQDYLSR